MTTPLRYERQMTPVNHPYYVREAYGQRHPKVVEGAGIWDKEAREWAAKPGMKADCPLSRVRELNGLEPLTLPKVTAALRKSGITLGKWHASGQVRGWGDYLAGALVTQCDDGRIEVRHVCGRWTKNDAEVAAAMIPKYAKALTKCRLAHTIENNRIYL